MAAINNFIKKIVGKAFEKAEKIFSYTVSFKNGNNSVDIEMEEYFDDTFDKILSLCNNTESKSLACAEAFALNAINSASKVHEVNKQIDELFTQTENKSLLDEYGISEAEKTDLCKNIKNMVSNELSVKGSTKEETDFINKINEVFDKNAEDKNAEDKNAEYLNQALDYISNVNRYINEGASEKDALDAAYNDMMFLGGSTEIAETIFNEINTLANSISKNERLIDAYMQKITANYFDDEKDVTAKSFSTSYEANPNALSDDEKTWAHKAYSKLLYATLDLDNGWDVFSMDVRNFRANGKQIISDEEFENAKDENGFVKPDKQQEMEAKIASRVAAGDEMSVINRMPEKSVNVNPAEIRAKTQSEKYLFHYPDSLTSDEKKWAEDLTANLISSSAASMGGLSVELTRFMADGKQIISDAEYDKNLPLENYAKKIAEKIASGAEIAINLSAPQQKPELLKLDISEIYSEKEPASHKSFSEHFKSEPNNLTPEEKSWALEAFDKMYFGSMDLQNDWNENTLKITNFCANGKQIISDEEFANTKAEDIDKLKIKVAFSLAQGDKISVRREIEEKNLEIDTSKIKTREAAEIKPEEPAKEAAEKTAEPAKEAAEKNVQEMAATAQSLSAPAPAARNVIQRNVTPQMFEAKRQIPAMQNRYAANRTPNAPVQSAPSNGPYYKGFVERFLVNIVKLVLGVDLEAIKAAEKAAERTAERTEPVRTKTSFAELMGTNSAAARTNRPAERTQERTLSQKGRTM